jgi:hypothetical protein
MEQSNYCERQTRIEGKYGKPMEAVIKGANGTTSTQERWVKEVFLYQIGISSCMKSA